MRAGNLIYTLFKGRARFEAQPLVIMADLKLIIILRIQ